MTLTGTGAVECGQVFFY